MNHVLSHIEYLVRRYDCVVLPSWGAFIANYQPACYDEGLNVMYPPRRELSFSANVDHNDGLLISSVARRERMPFNLASRLVEEEISAMKYQLANDGEVSLGRIGRFIKQTEGASAIFQPSAQIASLSAGGFDALHVEPLMHKVKAEAEREGRMLLPRRSRLSRVGLRAAKIAAVFAVVIGISAVLMRPHLFNRNDDMASVASVISARSSQTFDVPQMGKEALSLYIQVPAEETFVVKQVSETDGDKLTQSETVAERTVSNANGGESPARFNASDRYCLVIASLPTMADAEKYIGMRSSQKLGILAKDNKYRVYIATGNTTNEALQGRSIGNVASQYPDAWVCSMR